MLSTFQIVEVPSDAQREQEQMGTKPKFWFQDKDQGYCLYKEARPNTGEDWAEKVAAELCGLLHLPHAAYELAVWQNTRGVITPNFVSPNAILIPGNEALFQRDASYPVGQRFKVAKHTIEAVFGAFRELKVQLPRGDLLASITTAAQLFVGYLMLDAWIGNTDRHHENWALIQQAEHDDQTNVLAPTHDHASSLGCILLDEERRDRLTTKDTKRSVEKYVKKGRSALYESETDAKPLPLIDAFVAASHECPEASKLWLKSLENVTLTEVSEVFARVPDERISGMAAEFALRILEINRARLLELK